MSTRAHRHALHSARQAYRASRCTSLLAALDMCATTAPIPWTWSSRHRSSEEGVQSRDGMWMQVGMGGGRQTADAGLTAPGAPPRPLPPCPDVTGDSLLTDVPLNPDSTLLHVEQSNAHLRHVDHCPSSHYNLTRAHLASKRLQPSPTPAQREQEAYPAPRYPFVLSR